MRVRKMSALLGAALILVGCMVLYMMMDLAVSPSDVHDNKWIQFEGRLKLLEENLHRHHETVGKLKHTIKQLINNNSPVPDLYQRLTNRSTSALSTTTYAEPVVSCSIQFKSIPRTDIQMLEVYDELKFDNIDGGAWKQGWNIEYNAHQWDKNNKLKVFVVPHSHNDPGWIKTFEDYYQSQTRNILNNMVAKLSEDPRRKFIWAEISFFSLWWDEIPIERKEQVKKLVADGQLEIVTGGWVMNDEANTHYFSMLLQMTEGHHWLINQLEFKPRNSWSIDPFGQSPTMAYLLKRMGLENLVIQRVHYSVKKHLARSKNLEFRWRQLWDDDGSTDLLTHMMPFYSYDVPHTCGPDPKICCQFDFRRLPGYGISCPWKVPPQTITNQNVAHRAALLLDQYRKKAQLYRTNVVLAPLGDDFRYDHASEWDVQYNNYQKIFDYWNSKPNLFVEAQFGTLSDFFNAVREESKAENFPSLSGDFFTYADRDDHYWSGYYTSRPFYKRMDRVLVSYIRAAELLFTLAWSSKSSSDWLLAPESGLTKLLSDARRSLSLFQHHDGITGTARDHVVEDYAKKMLDAINGMQHVMQQAAHFLLSPPQVTYQPNSEFVYFDLDDMRKHHYSIPEKTVVFVGEGLESQRVVIYNSLTWRRQELVTLRVSTLHVKVTDASDITIPTQTSPVFQQQSDTIIDSQFEITFMADVPALGLATYFLHAVLPAQNMDNTMSHVKLLNFVGHPNRVEGFEDIEVLEEPKEFTIHNEHLSAAFSELGLLKAVTLKDSGVTVPLHMDFVRYHARPGSERSGAYLFLPDREAETVIGGSFPVRVLEGTLFSQVHVHLPNVQHTVTLVNTPGADSLGLDVQNVVNIADQVNCELAMRISTNIKNVNEFYTDLNGWQIIRRKRFFKLPLQANYYPLPTLAFIQDQNFRFTVVTGQPMGMGSLKEGQIEVMQDRRLNQDDNRGLGQGVTDNRPLPATFRLILEKRKPNCQGTPSQHPGGLPTMAAHLASLSLLNPLYRLLWLGKTRDKLEPRFTPVVQEPGCDFHVVMLQTFQPQSSNSAGLVMHRQETDPCFALDHFPLSNGLLNVSSLLPSQFGKTMRETTLTFLEEGKTVQKSSAHPVCLMEMAAYVFPR